MALVKKDKARFEDYPSGYPNSISYGYVQFKTGGGETLLDGLLGATVEVEAEDRHGIDVEARYVDDGGAFVDDLADGEDLSKGAIGEEAAYAMARERNYEVPDWFEKDSEYQNGIDLIAKDKDTGQWVFIESKFSSSRGSVGIGDLSKPDTKGRQMSDEWLIESIEDLRISGTISDTEARDLINAIRFGDSRKEMVVVKNTHKSGFTVAESLNDVDVDGATIYKTGEVVE